MTDKANKDLEAHKGKEYMTVPIDDALKQKAYETLIKARMTMLFKHAFFGQLALRLTLTPADRKWCPTAATDGRKFYYNPAFIAQLDDKENVFLVAHELGHCIYEHFSRRGGRDPELFNIAGDYIINNVLDIEMVKKGDYARVITYVKPYLDHKYDGWTTEEVYDDLQQQKDAGGKPEEDGDLIDVHLDMTGGGAPGEGDDDGVEVEGLAGKPGPLSEEERKQLGNEMKDAMIQAAAAAATTAPPQRCRHRHRQTAATTLLLPTAPSRHRSAAAAAKLPPPRCCRRQSATVVALSRCRHRRRRAATKLLPPPPPAPPDTRATGITVTPSRSYASP